MNASSWDIRDLALADQGQGRIQWALQDMPVLRELTARLASERPLRGVLKEEQQRNLSSWQEGT